MGKASKWIRNFLIGQKKDKDKKKSGPSIVPKTHMPGTPMAMVQQAFAAGNIKRRWSFKTSSSTKPTVHKANRSFDSIHMPKQALLEYEAQEQNTIRLVQNAQTAATKIQAAYRSYLARRALRALRGLVKLQALARGHLVRKQMTAVLRSMHAAMTIQVRARIHRVQMAEEPSVSARKSFRDSSTLRNDIREKNEEGNFHQMRESSRNRSGHIDHKPAEELEFRSRGCNSGRNSITQIKYYQQEICPTPSLLSFTDASSMTNDGQLDEVSKMARLLKLHSVRSQKNKPFLNPLASCPDHIAYISPSVPNYMSNTRSSNAKARSQSEPRQRPKLGRMRRSRRSSSMDGNIDKQNEYPRLNEVDFGSRGSAYTRLSSQKFSHILFDAPEILY